MNILIYTSLAIIFAMFLTIVVGLVLYFYTILLRATLGPYKEVFRGSGNPKKFIKKYLTTLHF